MRLFARVIAPVVALAALFPSAVVAQEMAVNVENLRPDGVVEVITSFDENGVPTSGYAIIP